MMKKVLFIAIACMALVVLFTGCQNGYSRLKEAMAELQRELPMKVAEGLVVNDLYLDEDARQINYVFKIDEGLYGIDISRFSENKDQMKHSLIVTFSSMQDRNYEKMIDECLNAGVDICFIYTGKNSDSKCEILLDQSDLKEIKANIENGGTTATGEDALDAMINANKAQLPVKINEGVTMTDVRRSGNDLLYAYEIDPEIVSIEAIEESRGEVKAAMLEELRSDNPVIKRSVDICKQYGANIIYRYEDPVGGNSVDITISPSEI